jgi:hypothetical protein
LSWQPSGGPWRDGARSIIIFGVHGVGGFPRGLIFILIIFTELGGRDLAIVLKVNGVLFRAIRGKHTSFLAVLHEVGLNEVLKKRHK